MIASSAPPTSPAYARAARRGSDPAWRAGLAAGVVLLVGLAASGSAWAHKNGITVNGCDGCHNGGQPATVTLTASPASPAVGQAVTLTVTVSETNGPAAGFYLTTEPLVGTFTAIQAGTAASALGVTHTMPHIGSGGVTTFQAQWSASQPTGVQFVAYGLSANNDGTSQGDGAGEADLSTTYGCAGTSYYLDEDADGYGTSDPAYPIRRDCSLPKGYASVAGDCNDLDPTVHPGAPEICDGQDNDCNGQIDENLPIKTYCPDGDGDGHGVPGGTTKMGCAAPKGYGDCGGDCNDSAPTVYPGAPELCDGIDNNCNGQVDEGARTTCGVGWCRRYAVGCTSLCTPGAPRAETCNDFDDDCDGVVDNGTDLELCGAPGLKCVAGVCVSSTSDAGSGGARDAGAGASTGAGGLPGTSGSAGAGGHPGPRDAAVEADGGGVRDASSAGGGGRAGQTAGTTTGGCDVGQSGGVGIRAGMLLLGLAALALVRGDRRRGRRR